MNTYITMTKKNKKSRIILKGEKALIPDGDSIFEVDARKLLMYIKTHLERYDREHQEELKNILGE